MAILSGSDSEKRICAPEQIGKEGKGQIKLNDGRVQIQHPFMPSAGWKYFRNGLQDLDRDWMYDRWPWDQTRSSASMSQPVVRLDGRKFWISGETPGMFWPEKKQKLQNRFRDIAEALAQANNFDLSSLRSIHFLNTGKNGLLPLGAFLGSVANASMEVIELVQGIPESFLNIADLPDGVLTISVEFRQRPPSSDLIELHISFNRPGREWEALRCHGLNLPILVVNRLLDRRISVFHTLNIRTNHSFARWHIEIGEIHDAIAFDLDGTLVSSWGANRKVVKLAITSKRLGYNPFIVTRNQGDIQAILHEASIPESIFDEIVQVSPNESKSKYLSSTAVLIDDEFGQRFDVSLSNITALSPDQIDFLSLSRQQS